MDSKTVATALSDEKVRGLIPQSVLSQITQLHVVDSISSTNDYLMQLPASNRQGFVVCAANQQTAGRGRRGREWQSPANANIYFSVGYCFRDIAISRLGCLSLVSGVVVCRVLESLGLRPGIKWPNDILLDSMKLAGILVETRLVRDEMYAVIGVGVNVDMPAQAATKIDQSWTDLSSAFSGSDRLCDRNLLIAELVSGLVNACRQFELTSMESFLSDWERYDLLAQRDVIISGPDQADVRAKVTGIADDCALRVIVDGYEKSVYEAEVKLKLINDDCD